MRLRLCGRLLPISSDDFLAAFVASAVLRCLWIGASVALLAAVPQLHRQPCLRTVAAWLGTTLAISAIGTQQAAAPTAACTPTFNCGASHQMTRVHTYYAGLLLDVRAAHIANSGTLADDT